ncbi:MAG: aminotransferase class V-fold PLP-dependent enzyme [Oligoflexia bacterium]|nr:aminotransferase class V-fold PLP-dependent enzyme [Oligoflexia bacterium]
MSSSNGAINLNVTSKRQRRLYLDYNSTSPLLPYVAKQLFDKSNKHFVDIIGNSSSTHSSGKNSKRLFTFVSDYLLDYFNLKNTHKVLFHSGATEGINIVVKGWALKRPRSSFYFSPVDHSAIWSVADDLSLYASINNNNNIKLSHIPVNSNGEYQYGENSENGFENGFENGLLNFTYVNNETGVVNSLEEIVALKRKYPSLLIHVDAVQLPGKIENFHSLDPNIDFYTFSGHKFGALTGVGFTFIKNGVENQIHPLISGGGQQQNLRSGSENLHGIYSLMLALEYLRKHFSYDEQLQAKVYFEKELKKFLGGTCSSSRGEIVGCGAKNRDLSTVMFILYNCKSDILQMAFDLAGIDVSRGSACKAQTVEENRVLLAMGYPSEMSKKAIRISFSTYMTLNKAKVYFQKTKKILERFVK